MQKSSKPILEIKRTTNMRLHNHALKIFENNTDVKSQRQSWNSGTCPITRNSASFHMETLAKFDVFPLAFVTLQHVIKRTGMCLIPL